MAETVRIIGIDPGSQATGYGVLDVAGNHCTHLASGTLRATETEFTARLQRIYLGIAALVAEYRPQEIAIERVFVHRNADSAIKLGQARGAALCGAFTGAGIGVHEYSPRQIKLAVVGTGGAAKTQVQHMVRMLLELHESPASDAADALAVALCHAHSRRTAGLIASQLAAGGGRRSRARRS